MATNAPTQTPSIGERFASSWHLFKVSFGVVRREPALIGLTLISMVVKLAVFFGLLALTLTLFVGAGLNGLLGDTLPETAGPALLATILFILVWALLISGPLSAYFGGAIAHVAMERIEGRDPSVGSGLGAARRRFRPLAVFGLITGVVRMLTSRSSSSGSASVVDHVADAAATAARELYRLLTSLALPAIMRERIGGTEAIGRSTAIVRSVWPQAVASGFGVRGVTSLVSAIPFLLFLGVFLISNGGVPTTGVINADGSAELDMEAILASIGALLPLLAACLSVSFLVSTLGGIVEAVFNGALYLYATTGRAGDFEAKDLAAAAVTRDGVVKPGAASTPGKPRA